VVASICVRQVGLGYIRLGTASSYAQKRNKI
jgi:hypothetical protein